MSAVRVESSVLESWQTCEEIPPSVEILLDQLLVEKNIPKEAQEAHVAFIDYLEKNGYRMNYLFYRSRGYKLASGAIESLHRKGSQIRLKLPGLTTLAQTSQAIFNFRMRDICGRWDEFWQQPGFYDKLVEAFSSKKKEAVQVLENAA